MNPVTLVVLGRFPDIFDVFRDNVNKLLPSVSKVFVRDGTLITPPVGEKWTTIQGPPTFSMTGNGNLGWKQVPTTDDTLYVGDDVRFTQGDTVELLQEAAYSDPEIGILSPKILGAVGNPLQKDSNSEGLTYSDSLCFVCVYIKREVLDKVGYMDTIFGTDYGFDDIDYCWRTTRAGYKLAITPRVQVEHHHASATFARTTGTNC